MHRLPGSSHTTPSPPHSPSVRSPRFRHRKQGGRAGQPPSSLHNFAQRLSWLLLSFLLRRQGIFLFAPLLYISGMLLYMASVSFDVVPGIVQRAVPGSVYRSPQVYAKLKPEMDSDNSTIDAMVFGSLGQMMGRLSLFAYDKVGAFSSWLYFSSIRLMMELAQNQWKLGKIVKWKEDLKKLALCK